MGASVVGICLITTLPLAMNEPDNPFRRLPARSTLGNSKREQKSDPLE